MHIRSRAAVRTRYFCVAGSGRGAHASPAASGAEVRHHSRDPPRGSSDDRAAAATAKRRSEEAGLAPSSAQRKKARRLQQLQREVEELPVFHWDKRREIHRCPCTLGMARTHQLV